MRGPYGKLPIPRRRSAAVAIFIAILAFGAPSAFAQCEPTTDCNSNGVLDDCDLTLGTSDDCNGNQIPDECDIASGFSEDCNTNAIPDECEPAPTFALSPTTVMASAESVVIRGDIAVVGSPDDATLGAGAGAVHVFRRVGTTWIDEGILLTAADGAAGDAFGTSVSLDGTFLAIGAPGADGATPDIGATYIFRRNATSGWLQTAKLSILPPIANEGLGASVSLRGNRLIAGAPQTAAGGTGRAVIFSFNGLSWSIDAILAPAGLAPGDNFGSSVGMALTHAFVGAWGHTALGTPAAGEVFVYEISGTWALDTSLTAPTPESAALFGIELAGTDAFLAVGAPNQDAGAGATHIFRKLNGLWTHDLELTTPAATPAQGFGHDLDLARVGGRLIISEQEATTPTAVPGSVHIYTVSPGAVTHESSLSGAIGEEFGSSVSVNGVYAEIASRAVPSAEVVWIAPVSDCNGNAIDDLCDISGGASSDCNGNSIPDSCDLASGTSADCDGNLTPDECQLDADPSLDCNGNGVLDSCDLASTSSFDCNSNGIPDECDIALGTEVDCLGDGIPDSCQGIFDTVAPVFTTFPADLNLSPDVGNCSAIVTWTEPTVSDDCAVATVTASQQQGASFPVGSTIVTYTATDLSGNTVVASFTVSIVDNTGPAIVDLPADFTVPTTSGFCSAVVSWTPPTASDGCGLISFTSNVPNNSTRPAGATVVTYTATDVHGNVSTASFTVTVEDSIAPTIFGAPGDQVLSASAGSCGAIATWSAPVVTDNCPAPQLVSDATPGSFFPVGTTTVTYDASDASGNVATASFTITVIDDLPPVLSNFPLDQTIVLAPGTCSAQAFWTPPTATDNCGIVSFSSNLGRGVTLPSGVYPITYTATDTTGLTTQQTFVLTIADQEAPAVTGVPADINLTLGSGSCTAVATWTPPTATDNCALNTLIPSHNPGTAFPAGTTTVTYTASDPTGNSTVVSFDVIVADIEPPTIPDLPGFILIGTDPGACSATATWAEPLGADTCGVASVTSTHAPGSSFPVGDTIVTYTVTDLGGNSVQGSFAVSVSDLEDPTISGLPPSITAETDPNSCGANVTWAAPTISDNCAVTDSGASHVSGDFFPVGTTVVSFDATDAAGNVGTATLTVIVTDTMPPTVGPVPAGLTLSTDAGICGRVVSWPPPAFADNCAVLSFDATHFPGETFPVGSTTVTYTATDTSGNVTVASFIVEIADDVLPTLTVGPDVTVPADAGSCGAELVIATPTVSDNCGLASVTNDFTGTGDASGLYPLGTTTVTWTATDVNGNVATAVQLVTVDLPPGSDCNANGVPDLCDVLSGTSLDCNSNGVPDECDISAGTSNDSDGNNVPDECDATFMRGDINNDGTMNIADAIFLLQRLFVNGAAPACDDAADVNDDGLTDISDVIFSINYIFAGGAAPAAPFPECGIDPTADTFDCANYSNCP